MMRQGYMVLMFQIFGMDSAKGAIFMTTPHKRYFISCFVDRIASCNNLTNTTIKPFLYPTAPLFRGSNRDKAEFHALVTGLEACAYSYSMSLQRFIIIAPKKYLFIFTGTTCFP